MLILGPIWYQSEPSDVPYPPNQFLGWDFFSVSYSKPALIRGPKYIIRAGSFYNYEPLTFAGIRRIHETETELVLSTQNVINGIFTCNFSSVFNECK